MTQFLKRLDIANFGEVEEVKTQYLKRVNIVEVVDENGNPWEPVTWDELVVLNDTRWSNLNNYSVGEEIFGTPATYTGGSDQVTYRYRWQTKANADDAWINGAWTNYTGAPEVSTIAAAGYVRLHAQARDSFYDPVVQVNSFGPSKHILNVGSVNISGDRMAGETIECSQPTASGGAMPYTTTFTWSNGATGKTYQLQNSDVGNDITCTAKVVDADGNRKEVTSNSLGPIVQYTLGTPNPQVNGVDYDGSAEEVANNSEALLTMGMSGNSPNITYTWEVRSGDARLSDQGNGANYVIFNNSGLVSIQGNALEPYASDSTGQSQRFEFIVSSE